MSSFLEKLDNLGLLSKVDPEERVPLDQKDLEHIENLLGFPIPGSYWEFQKVYGQSSFRDGVALYEVPDDWDRDGNGAPNEIWSFFSVDAEQEHQVWNLAYVIRGTQESKLPPHFLPICISDGLATWVYLSCRQEDFGHVYALDCWQGWDLDNDDIAPDEACDLAYHLADSFEDFVDKIYIVPDDQSEATEPVSVALRDKDLSFFQQIVDAGEVASYRNSYGSTLLECAVSGGDLWAVEFLLQHTPPSENRLEAMWWAVLMLFSDELRLLLSRGANPNAKRMFNSDGWETTLTRVVRSWDYKKKYGIAQLLMEFGADQSVGRQRRQERLRLRSSTQPEDARYSITRSSRRNTR